MPRIVPSEIVSEIRVEEILDFLACPFRYCRRRIEKDPNARPTRSELIETLTDRLANEVHRAKSQTGKTLLREDVDAIAGDIGSDLGMAAEPLEEGTGGFWRWWRELEAEGASIVATRAPYGLTLEEAGGAVWTLRGAAPFVIRRAGETPRAAILRPTKVPPGDPRDLEIPILQAASREVLGLDGVVELHEVSPDPMERAANGVRIRQIAPSDKRVDRMLTVVSAVRQAIVGALTGEAYGFYPARWSATCSRSLCRNVATCEDVFGPGVSDK